MPTTSLTNWAMSWSRCRGDTRCLGVVQTREMVGMRSAAVLNLAADVSPPHHNENGCTFGDVLDGVGSKFHACRVPVTGPAHTRELERSRVSGLGMTEKTNGLALIADSGDGSQAGEFNGLQWRPSA